MIFRVDEIFYFDKEMEVNVTKACRETSVLQPANLKNGHALGSTN